MSPALYTLIGALGGVIITQVANYFLEGRRAKTQLSLKQLEIDGSKSNDLQKSRRDVYARYLLKIDQYVVERHDPAGEEADLLNVMDDYYIALILAGEDTSYHINGVFKMCKNDPFDYDMFDTAKKKLLEAMKNELQQKI